MSKKIGIEPREVELVIAPSQPLTAQAAQEIARFVAASKQKNKRGQPVASTAAHAA
jgi:hypothetical protein